MYCENCGNGLSQGDKFCTKCGHATMPGVSGNIISSTSQTSIRDDRWWYRLLKVIYIVGYIPLPLVLWLTWISNNSSYDYYTSSSTDTSGTAFWYTLIALAIYMGVIRLVKIAVLYVAAGRKPEWKKEFKKLF